MKNILTKEESQALEDIGFRSASFDGQFTLEELIDYLDQTLDGHHYEFVRHFNGWEVMVDGDTDFKRREHLINAIAGTLYVRTLLKNEEE